MLLAYLVVTTVLLALALSFLGARPMSHGLAKRGTRHRIRSNGIENVAEGGLSVIVGRREALESLFKFDPFSKTNTRCVSTISGRTVFRPGDFICSPNKSMLFGMDDDGDLGIWKGARKVWTAGSYDASFANFQLDGNLVAYNAGLVAIWESNTAGPQLVGGQLEMRDDGAVIIRNDSAGKTRTIMPFPQLLQGHCETELRGIARLGPNENICSKSGRYRFGMAGNGDLGIWNGPTQIWSAETCCREEENIAHLQIDGNFVVRGSTSGVLWRSRTHGEDRVAGGVIRITDAGIAIITNENARKRLSIVPMPHGAQLRLEELELPQSPEGCIDQGVGRVRLIQNAYICSLNGKYRFGVSAEGDLHLLQTEKILWSAGTCCANDDVYVTFQRDDGNLVVRNGNQDVLWTSRTGDPQILESSLSLSDSGVVSITNPEGTRVWAARQKPAPSSCLAQGATRGTDLVAGQFVCSPNMRFRFGVIDSTLSLWDRNEMIWSLPKCCGRDDIVARMLVNGNLVVLSESSGSTLWTSSTTGHGCEVEVGDDGIAKILSCSGDVLWSASLHGIERPKVPSTASPSAMLSPRPSPSPGKNRECSDPRDSLIVCVTPQVGRIRFGIGTFLCSPDKRYRFGLAADGDLVVLDGKNTKLWSAGTSCQDVELALLQLDGNLIVSNGQGVIWASATTNNYSGETSLLIGNDGIATITSSIAGHLWSTVVQSDEGRVDSNTLNGKVMSGYQGWFFTKGDQGRDEWVHWGQRRKVPNQETITIDYWPDLRELEDDELYPTEFRYEDGSNAGLYSAYNRKTVERHFKWMYEYGIDGVFKQRFIGNAVGFTDVEDTVLANVRSGAEKYGRLFANMYDISNHRWDGNSLVQDIINDWMHLVDDEHITASKQYLRHKGKPLVAVWGFGFDNRVGDPYHLRELLRWFQFDAAPKYRATVMGGVPEGWRDLSRSSKTNQNWAAAYRSYDVISPWSVGRLRSIRDADKFLEEYIIPDKSECDSLGIDYLPVVYPGFSFHNLYPHKELNGVPRLGGTFFWRQLHNAASAGNQMVYVAMFDEVDEGTAIFKLAENDSQTPTTGKFVTLDADSGYPNVPNDWYLQLTGEATRLISEGRPIPRMMPGIPENVVRVRE